MGDHVKEEWLRVGRVIRRIRTSRGFSLEQLSKRLTISPAMISAVERGVRSCKPDIAEQIDAALATNGVVSRMLHSTGGGIPEWFRDIDRLQRSASEIRQFQLGLVPGLLQVEGYARAQFQSGYPRSPMSHIDALVTGRMGRQALLWADDRPQLLVVLDEGVLSRPVGGYATLTKQLDHLLDVGTSANITIQIVRLSTAPHPGLDGSFQLLTVEGRQVVVLETRNKSLLVEDPRDPDAPAEYAAAFEDLRAVALPPAESEDLVRKVRESID